MAHFVALEKLMHLHDGYCRRFLVERDDILLIQLNGTVSAVRNYCPHQGFPLHDGMLTRSGIRCKWHGMDFSLPSGRCFLHDYCLEHYEIAYESDRIGVMLEE